MFYLYFYYIYFYNVLLLSTLLNRVCTLEFYCINKVYYYYYYFINCPISRRE